MLKCLEIKEQKRYTIAELRSLEFFRKILEKEKLQDNYEKEGDGLNNNGKSMNDINGNYQNNYKINSNSLMNNNNNSRSHNIMKNKSFQDYKNERLSAGNNSRIPKNYNSNENNKQER